MLKKLNTAESRKSVRKKLFKRGFVRTPNGSSSFDCIVRDLSEGGAKLRFRCTPEITDCFELHIPADGAILQSKLVWINHCEAGVSFDPIDSDKPTRADYSEIFVRVTALEEEVAELRRLIGRQQLR